jgi:hypothetical protein
MEGSIGRVVPEIQKVHKHALDLDGRCLILTGIPDGPGISGGRIEALTFRSRVPDTFQLGAISQFLAVLAPRKIKISSVFSISLNIPTPPASRIFGLRKFCPEPVEGRGPPFTFARRRELRGTRSSHSIVPGSGSSSPCTVTFQELLLQSLRDKESARLQPLQNLWEITHETHRVRTFQDTQRSGERDTPAQSNGSSNLFINQKHICPECFR